MSRYTDLATEIITSKQGRQVYDDIAQVYGESYASLWMMQVIGIMLDEFRTFSKEFILQVTPVTATWTIEFWEKQYGIVPNLTLSLDQRRGQILTKMMRRSAITPYRIEQTVQSLTGIECSVLECSDGKDFDDDAFHLILKGHADDKTITLVKNAINKIKPSHLYFTIKDSELFKTKATRYTATSGSAFTIYKIGVNR